MSCFIYDSVRRMPTYPSLGGKVWYNSGGQITQLWCAHCSSMRSSFSFLHSGMVFPSSSSSMITSSELCSHPSPHIHNILTQICTCYNRKNKCEQKKTGKIEYVELVKSILLHNLCMSTNKIFILKKSSFSIYPILPLQKLKNLNRVAQFPSSSHKRTL